MPNMFNLKSVKVDPDGVLDAHGLAKNGEVQKFIDSEVLRYCEPCVPLDQGTLIQSGIINTVVGSGQVKYRTPYARRWYYMPANFQEAPRRGNYWFERAIHEEGGKDKILDGARKLAGAKT